MALRLATFVICIILIQEGCTLLRVRTTGDICREYRFIEVDSVIPIPKVLFKTLTFIDSVHSINKWEYGIDKNKVNDGMQWNIYCTIGEINEDSIGFQFNYSVGSYRLFSEYIEIILPSKKVLGYYSVNNVNVFVLYYENNPKVNRDKLKELFPTRGTSIVAVETIVSCCSNQIIHDGFEDYISRYIVEIR